MFSKEKRNRKKEFKKGIDSEDARRKREDNSVEIRKSKRDEQVGPHGARGARRQAHDARGADCQAAREGRWCHGARGARAVQGEPRRA